MAKAVNTTITNCGNEATINVTNKNAKNIAGITGYSENTTITNSYNAGDITGGARVSGITGEIKTYTSIENCYNTGSVTTTATRTIYSGGLVGYGYGATNNVSTVKNSYTLPCKENLRMGATLWGIEVYGPDRSFGSIGILDRIRAPDYRPSRRNPYQCSDFNGGLPVPDVSAHVRLG